MMIFAHRGASGHAPENTLAAMKKAIALGATAVELDIHNVKGELYVYHDRRLNNAKMHYPLIEQTNIHTIQHTQVEGEAIPSLWQVMDYLKQHPCTVNIELKGLNSLQPFMELYPKLINDLGFKAEQLLISSFHHPFLATFRQSFSQAYLAPIVAGVPLSLAKVATTLGAYSIHLNLNFVTPEMIIDAHNRGIKVFVYTVNDLDDMSHLYQAGVDGIFTNYPDKALSLFPIKS
ncbi:glycerophosphodiester phosphodiesterase [Shewanella surugensis]|uniref:Glycerophosphodiester phosphodiesterase n=1 Tax=Shewanella surugensis TaxID=212020 RepID=A0ABT0LA43_9GAMM|nr:glycerophosphodiester phosphodiesterase [Shewanella surugensis]MCL1124579.1 glycerophosphodiester phosphodiesterase [Shewanella surugensis]